MQITVIGTGFVGVVTAVVFAKFGNMVTGLDSNEQKIKKLRSGEVPFYEPNLLELVRENLKAGRLKFTTNYSEAIPEAEVIFICVGTPSGPSGQVNLEYVFSAAQSLAPLIMDRAIIVIKSTVPPSTSTNITHIIHKLSKQKFFVASVPEFLREGSAVSDSLNPQRILIGANMKEVIDRLTDLHKPLKGEVIVMSPESAQLTKYAANTYLALRIAYINEIANLCEKTGADIEQVIEGLGSDERIGAHYWYPGLGYGGSCFPKDVKELSALAGSVGEGDGLFHTIDRVNEKRMQKLMRRFERVAGGYRRKRIAILGLSFKPNTNDLREAPSTKLIPMLLAKGAQISVYDPKAMSVAKSRFAESVRYAQDAYDAAKGSQILMLLTEWDEFKQLNLAKLRKIMQGKIFIDTRNVYEPRIVREAGFTYIGIGR